MKENLQNAKIRELLPQIKEMIAILTDAAQDAAELELTNNKLAISSNFRKMIDLEGKSKLYRAELSKIRAEKKKK